MCSGQILATKAFNTPLIKLVGLLIKAMGCRMLNWTRGYVEIRTYHSQNIHTWMALCARQMVLKQSAVIVLLYVVHFIRCRHSEVVQWVQRRHVTPKSWVQLPTWVQCEKTISGTWILLKKLNSLFLVLCLTGTYLCSLLALFHKASVLRTGWSNGVKNVCFVRFHLQNVLFSVCLLQTLFMAS